MADQPQPATLPNTGAAHVVAFAVRCAAAASLSYLAANALHLPHPVWAAMSGVIVSQESYGETRHAAMGRLIGTIVGIVVAVVVGTLTARLGIGVAAQMAIAVAITAVAADRYPAIRVCMWTCPIIFLTADPGTPLLTTSVHRGAEVLIGAAIGAALHLVAHGVRRE